MLLPGWIYRVEGVEKWCQLKVKKNHDLRCKMAAYPANGALLGWLLLPAQPCVEQWQAQGSSTRLENLTLLEAGHQFPGLTLDLSEIWAEESS